MPKSMGLNVSSPGISEQGNCHMLI